MDFIRLFTSPEGRIGRVIYWIGWIILIVLEIVVRYTLFGDSVSPKPSDPLSLRALSFVIDLVLLYPAAMLMAKRLHDRDRSAWLTGWLIVPYAVHMITNLLGMSGDPDRMGPAETVLLIAIAIIALTFIVELGFRPGTDGANQYGPDPLKRGS